LTIEIRRRRRTTIDTVKSMRMSTDARKPRGISYSELSWGGFSVRGSDAELSCSIMQTAELQAKLLFLQHKITSTVCVVIKMNQNLKSLCFALLQRFLLEN
jgi:hypothetical protein